MNAALVPQEISHALTVGLRPTGLSVTPLRLGSEIEILGETGSTNDVVTDRAAAGAAEGLAVFAERQTAGRGRKAVDWIAPPRQNLTFSVLLRPGIPLADWSRFAHAAGLAVIRGAEPWAENRRLQLKWPNDVLCEGRKLAGILLETGTRRGQSFLVLGIGLNVNSMPDDFPPDLSSDVCSVRWLSGGQDVDRSALAGSILAELNRAYDQAMTDFGSLLPEISRRSCLLGRRIEFRHQDAWKEAEVVGFGPNGELSVREDDHSHNQLILSAEHVRVTQK
ncbi:MAG: BirA family biotin operon repressor/biotin-[acetyl-CoA-carboxylase] ligase [Verrucomicrobiales bacterium]|jgi:BirA family biotin operon repressor/biotin-[acetyl-CoA-carboxylase] ligase